ncbi:MAG: hypothetical protein Q8Q48_04300 [Candidatus Staskawiczbacteria bacterium]|nr:hypothetical protein [Candidatus Staskawiczbacteria bacterium]
MLTKQIEPPSELLEKCLMRIRRERRILAVKHTIVVFATLSITIFGAGGVTLYTMNQTKISAGPSVLSEYQDSDKSQQQLANSNIYYPIQRPYNSGSHSNIIFTSGYSHLK